MMRGRKAGSLSQNVWDGRSLSHLNHLAHVGQHLCELLLVQSPSNAQAELCFRTAIEIARRLSARSMELRATTSLARLVAKQGRRANASLMLGDIYSRFTEGFDTVDLKAAKALLDQLDG